MGAIRGLRAFCRFSSAPIAYLLFPSIAQATSDNPYISAKDVQFQTDAASTAQSWCNGFPHGEIDQEAGRQALNDGVGGDNIILEILEESSDSNRDVTEVAEERFSSLPTPLLIKCAPVILSILVSIIWLALCCTTCPCKCCRCCVRARPKSPKALKAFALMFLGLVSLGIAMCIYIAAKGTMASQDGLENLACSAATFANTTFAGKSTSPEFIGLLPTLQVFDTLDNHFDSDSQFMTSIDALIASTAKIDRSVALASATLSLLQLALADPSNSNPSNTLGSSLYHKNLLSENLPPVLTPAINTLNAGVAVAMSQARAEAEAQLTPQKREDLQQALQDSVEPLKNAKDVMRESFSPFVDPQSRDDWWSDLELALTVLVAGLFVLAILILFCGCGSVLCCCRGDQETEGNSVHRLACCSWCCAAYLASVALFVGGIMLVTAVPISGLCLMMDDISGTMLTDIGPALNMNVQGDAGEMLKDMIDQCYNPPDINVPANFLDILFIRNITTDAKITMRTQFVDTLLDQINSRFDLVTEKFNQGLPLLAQDPAILSLKNMLSQNPIDTMFMPQTDPALSQNADYSAINSVSALAAVAWASSANCNDHTAVLPSVSSVNNLEMKGISSLLAEMQALGGTNPTAIANGLTCTQTVTCPSGSNNAACQAANNLMQLKAQLQSMGLNVPMYKCIYFSNPNGIGTCDVLNMAENNGVYTNDCLAADNTYTTSVVQCTLAEYVAYIADYSTRINTVMTRVDNVALQVKTDINVTMRGLLNDNILTPLTDMSNKMNCNFLGVLYDDIINSFCFQGMWGARAIASAYTALGILQFLLIFVMYAIYRVAKDNVAMKGREQA